MTDIVRVFHGSLSNRANGISEMNKSIDAFLSTYNSHEVKHTNSVIDGNDVIVTITLTPKKRSPC